jgi:hypothetical protein
MSAKAFRARLERLPGKLNWTIVRLPFDSAKYWGKRGLIKVKGEINGFPFRTSLFPKGDGTHFILINKKMQKAAKTQPGFEARFVLEMDAEERVVQVPPELQHALRISRGLQKFYDSFTPSMKSYISNSVSSAKQPETRKRRAQQAAEQLLEIMEAELDLPPLIRRAFDRNPQAAKGWKLMTPSHRRMHLFGIFYYRSFDARIRRLEKAIEQMAEYAERRS